MATLYTFKASNIRKTWFLMIGFFVAVMAIGWVVSYYYNNPGILVIAVFLAIVMNVTSYWFSDKIVIAMAGAKPADGPEYLELNRVVENIAITAGLPKPKVYIIQDQVPNAFATGRGPHHSAVAVTSGLLAIMNKTELEGVLAHELSHIGNRDMLVSTVAVVLVGFVSIVADMFMRMSFFGGNRNDRERGNALFLVFGIAAAILAPIAAQLIQLAISRRREYLADASGALITRYPEGLASALSKLQQYSQNNSGRMKNASTATAHLYISNPFGEQRKMGQRIAGLFSTHPPIEDRIRILREMEQ